MSIDKSGMSRREMVAAMGTGIVAGPLLAALNENAYAAPQRNRLCLPRRETLLG